MSIAVLFDFVIFDFLGRPRLRLGGIVVPFIADDGLALSVEIWFMSSEFSLMEIEAVAILLESAVGAELGRLGARGPCSGSLEPAGVGASGPCSGL